MPQMRQPTPEERAQAEKEWNSEKVLLMPPQAGVCLYDHKVLHPVHNPDYDGSTKYYCNKLCGKDRWRKLVDEGMPSEEAEKEVYKD